jgi:hypothetical protein
VGIDTAAMSTTRGLATVLPSPRAESGYRASREQAAERRRAVRERQLRRRQQSLVLALLAATWIPGALGTALHVPRLAAWGVASGYLGLSWALPGLIVGLAVDRSAKAHGVRAHRVIGGLAAFASIALLLVGAAGLIGS